MWGRTVQDSKRKTFFVPLFFSPTGRDENFGFFYSYMGVGGVTTHTCMNVFSA